MKGGLILAPSRLPDELDRLKALAVADEANPHTRRAYTQHLDHFFRWCVKTKSTPSKACVLAYRTELQKGLNLGRPYQANTINLKLAAIRRLCKEMYAARLIDAQELASVESVRNVRITYRKGQSTSLKARWLTLEEVQKLCRLKVGKEIFDQEKFQALVTLLCLTGLRITEVCSLKRGQVVKTGDRWLLVDVLTKGSKLETFVLPAAAYERLHKAWLLVDDGEEDTRIFRWAPNTVRKKLVEAGKQMGFWFTPHDLRRSFTKLASESGASIDQLCVALGHSSPRTTMRYLGDARKMDSSPGDGIKL